jgi:hypothetical protein
MSVRPTTHGRPFAIRQGEIGFDRALTMPDTPPPVDLALAAVIEVVPTPDPVAVTVVQSAHGSGTGGGISIKLPLTPTLGNTLIFAINQRNAGALDMTSTYGPAMPTWTVVANLYGEIAVLVKTADGVHDHNAYPDNVNEYLVKSPVANGGWFWAMWEVSGLDIATLVSATATDSGASMSVPIVPAAGAEAFEVGAFEIRASDVAVFAPGFYGTAGSGWTEDYASPATTYHPGALFEHRTVTAPNGSDSYPATGDRYEAAGANWYGVALAMNPLSTAPTTWELAPEIHDGDDATYHEADEADSGVVLRAMLDDTYRVSRCVVKLGHSAAGSKSYTLEGANLADFSDADTLDSVTFTATGSYTLDTITFVTPNTTAYQFLRLTGSTEARRFYTFEAYVDSTDLAAYQLRAEKGAASGYADLDASALVPIAELPVGTASTEVAAGNHGHAPDAAAAAHIVDASDAHDASAISIADTGANFAATDVEAALAELATATRALDDLSDVTAPTPSDADVLTWDAGTSRWIAQAAPGAGGGDSSGQLAGGFDGGGAAITAGSIYYGVVPFTGTITGGRILGHNAGAAGSAVFDVAVHAPGAFPVFPTDSIVAADPPTMTSDTEVTMPHITSWITAVTQYDNYAIKFVSGDVTWAALILDYSRP